MTKINLIIILFFTISLLFPSSHFFQNLFSRLQATQFVLASYDSHASQNLSPISSTQTPNPHITGNVNETQVFFPLVVRGLPIPNFLIIISDDQRSDTMSVMPRTKSQIFDQGVTFSNAYITTSNCCPSRASILTGMYANNHGVILNDYELQHRTFVENLHDAGYYTGLVGKYLNSWDGSPRPEYDYWVSFAGGAADYNGPLLNVQGEWIDHSGYITYILRDYALQFLNTALQQDKPFALIFTPNAPHEPATPPPGEISFFEQQVEYKSPSYNEKDVSDKPSWLPQERLTEEDKDYIDRTRNNQLKTLTALDEAVDRFLNTLSAAGELDNTFILYLSDNGFFWGEHRILRDKFHAYEESILVPFAIRYPPMVSEPRVESRLVANIDIAPTIYNLAHLAIPTNVDGLSLVPLLRGETEWRDKVVVENWKPYGHYIGVRSDRYLYVEWDYYRTELYDMENDPYQLENQADNPEYTLVMEEMHAFLESIRADQH